MYVYLLFIYIYVYIHVYRYMYTNHEHVSVYSIATKLGPYGQIPASWLGWLGWLTVLQEMEKLYTFRQSQGKLLHLNPAGKMSMNWLTEKTLYQEEGQTISMHLYIYIYILCVSPFDIDISLMFCWGRMCHFDLFFSGWVSSSPGRAFLHQLCGAVSCCHHTTHILLIKS